MSLVLVLLPLAAACLTLFGGRRLPALVAPVAVAGSAAALAVSLLLWFDVRENGPVSQTLGVVTYGGPPITFGFEADLSASTVSVMVCVVALLVQIYSVAYLKEDTRYSVYTAGVSLFTAAMLQVVLAADLIFLVIGWEIMGLCSYLLIGHHWELPDARSGAIKAFLVTRLGDVGFLFGIFVLGMAAGSFRIADVLAAAPDLPAATVTTGTLLLLAGVAGKSAQFPLQVWLPDAMAGPTPVSALIHAATMVAAGIYVVARLYPAFLEAPATLAVLAVVASIGMLGAALAALAQDDIKRVLAYSTVSQLAYMAAALAVGARDAALFQLLSHAAYKALLFLAAGAVIHAVGTNSMAAMGGLRRAMPLTFATMTIGLGALAGVPPLAGFFSKEAVLSAAEETALHGGPVDAWAAWLVLVAALLTVAVTAAYVMRLWLRTFFPPARVPQPVHEAPFLMWAPLVVLAVPALLFGLLGLRAGLVATWVASSGEEPEALTPGMVTGLLSLALLAAGALAVHAAWRRDPAGDPVAELRAGPLFAAGFRVDDFYDRIAVRPVWALARLVRRTDRDVIDAYVRGAGLGSRFAGGLLRRTQGGNISTYLTMLLFGVVLIAISAVAVLG